MRYLELLAPARNIEIGIAAIDCGADAVYIGGPDFGARKDAGNSIEDIGKLCAYAHRFGARVFVTFNTLLRPDELAQAKAQMLAAQEAGADAFIVRDPAIFGWKEISIPLHASTQCAIRTAERARLYESLGCARIVLERELPLSAVREIAASTDCEIEFFVHGALCVCYSGECRMSERINGRSADRGECIQACRSLYDLVDGDGNVLLRNKAGTWSTNNLSFGWTTTHYSPFGNTLGVFTDGHNRGSVFARLDGGTRSLKRGTYDGYWQPQGRTDISKKNWCLDGIGF